MMSTNHKHEVLVDLVNDILLTKNISSQKHFEYAVGELDILCGEIYFEIKCGLTKKSVKKAIEQIERARGHNYCDYGYLVTYEGVYDVMGERYGIQRPPKNLR